jgi:hypothetical protein
MTGPRNNNTVAVDNAVTIPLPVASVDNNSGSFEEENDFVQAKSKQRSNQRRNRNNDNNNNDHQSNAHLRGGRGVDGSGIGRSGGGKGRCCNSNNNKNDPFHQKGWSRPTTIKTCRSNSKKGSFSTGVVTDDSSNGPFPHHDNHLISEEIAALVTSELQTVVVSTPDDQINASLAVTAAVVTFLSTAYAGDSTMEESAPVVVATKEEVEDVDGND